MTSLAVSQPYRGADRRHSFRPVERPRPLQVLPVATVVVVVAAAAAAAALSDPARAAAVQDVRQLLRAGLLTGAGLLLMAQWRATGLARPAFVGLALLVLGVLSESVTTLSPLVHGSGDPLLSGPALRLLPALAAGVLFLSAGRARPVHADARPVRLLLGALLVGVFAGAGLLLLTASVTSRNETALLAACAAWRAALWLAICLREHRRARTERDMPWLVPVLAGAAVSAFFDVGHALEGEPFGAIAAVLVVATAALALRFAVGDLAHALSAQSARLLHLTADVTEHEQRSRTAHESQAVRLHEVRNVLAGLHGATSTLRRYEDRLDPGVRHRLEDAISAELQRLQHLVDPPASRPRERVRLHSALDAVITAERELGALIRSDLGRATVVGCAADVATICSALLVNARVHAPGAPVQVRARTAGDTVQLIVEDGGPGVPEDLREAVFLRGERGLATCEGSGLGLFNARQLAEEMDGRLECAPRRLGGASFVLTLPAAQSPAR